MALPATMRRFEISIADVDRGVYDAISLRVAQHPSETDRYLVARVIARCLEHDEGVDFSRGLAVSEEPALWQRDLTGELKAWIEVGSPSPDRLHKASKTRARVVVYAWKNVPQLAKDIAARSVHRVDELTLRAFEPRFLDELGAALDRRNTWDVSLSGGTLYVCVGDAVTEGTLTPVAIEG